MGLGGCIQNKEMVYYNKHFIGEMMPKTFEIPACGTVLLNSRFGDDEELGFKDSVNCILLELSIMGSACIEKVRYYLEDKEELRKIAKAGYELVRKNHDIYKTVNDLIMEIEKIYG
jgi:spore maturation protein CgeB